MILQQTSLFEMRRLEMLSNTIFGVAMTLLAYDLPKAGSFASAPGWIDLVRVYAQPVIALTISFVVAGLFWFSHHRRLAEAPEASRGVVFLNLLFLLSIIVLPVTNGLYGSYRLDGVVAVIYGIHLATIATLNGLLWIIALRGRRDVPLTGDGVIPDPGIRDRNSHRLILAEGGAVHMVPGLFIAGCRLARRTTRRASISQPPQPSAILTSACAGFLRTEQQSAISMAARLTQFDITRNR